MEFQDFSERSKWASQDEIGKAHLTAYFWTKSQAKEDFSVDDLLMLWSTLPVAQPNKSRLTSKMSRCGSFPRALKPNRFRLHIETRRKLDETYGHIWHTRRHTLRLGSKTFVDVERISELRLLTGFKPDPLRLVRLCEEINVNYAAECAMGVALLARTIINHVPPALGFKTFTEVANNYGGDPKNQRTFKKIAQRLDEAQRSIADSIAHETMRDVESLPTLTQIDFSQELDLLLGEVGRVLRSKRPI